MRMLFLTALVCISLTGLAPEPFPGGNSIDISQGWSLLKEGSAAEGTVLQDAKAPVGNSPHLVQVTVSKTADVGEGRVGAISSVTLPVEQDQWFDMTFSALVERGSIGIVFSLEAADGTVLARTTLPEIGRGPARRGSTTAPVTWNKCLVALHTRGASPAAHLTMTPIEPTNIWLDGLTVTKRTSTK